DRRPNTETPLPNLGACRETALRKESLPGRRISIACLGGGESWVGSVSIGEKDGSGGLVGPFEPSQALFSSYLRQLRPPTAPEQLQQVVGGTDQAPFRLHRVHPP